MFCFERMGRERSSMHILKRVSLAGLMIAASAEIPAMASDFDGSKPLICMIAEAISCRPNVECTRGTAESLKMPQFVWVDAAAKTFREKDPDGQIRTTSIPTVVQGTNDLILQGTKDDFA